MARKRIKITAKMLIAKRACPEQVDMLRAMWPKGAVLSERVLLQAARAGAHLDWFASRFLSAPARAEHKKVSAPAWAQYEGVSALAWEEYERVCAPAWAQYERVCAAVLWAIVKKHGIID